MKQIWAEDEAEFHGRFVNFDGIKSFPKPYQRPHPQSSWALECVVEVSDGWAPFLLDWPSTVELLVSLRSQLTAAGRAPDSVEVSVYQNSLPDEKTLAEMEEAGVKRYIFTVYDKPRNESLPLLDDLAKIMK